MKKTILISGIQGFLGSHLAATLLPDYALYGLAKEKGDLNGIAVFSSQELDAMAIVPDFVVLCHAAVSSGGIALSKEVLYEVNAGLTAQLAHKFKNSKTIYISSASVYGQPAGLIDEQTAADPQNDYAASKLAGETEVLKMPRSTVIRLSSLYGNGMKEVTIIPNYANQALRNKKIEVWGNGARRQNYIAVEDACLCIQSAIENFDAVSGKILLAVAKDEHSNAELAKTIADETAAGIVHIKEDISPSTAYDNQFTRTLLHWEPKTEFKNGIANYIQWKKEQF